MEWVRFKLQYLWPLYGGCHAALPLNITVVSGSFGGLVVTDTLAHTGNRVMIPESAHMLGDVGVGIQVATNMMRLLLRWGLRPALHAYSLECTVIIFRWYGTGKHVGCKHSVPHMARNHGAPHSTFNSVVYLVVYTV